MVWFTARVATGLLLGAALVAWAGPDSSAGATFLVVSSCLVVVVVSAVGDAIRARMKPNGP